MKNKILSLLLVTAMLSASALTSCGGGGVETDAPADDTQAQTEAPEGQPEETQAETEAAKETEAEKETEYVYTPDPNNQYTGGVGFTQYGTSVSYSSIKVTNNADRKVLLENKFDDASLEGWNYFSRGGWDAANTSDWAVADGSLTFTNKDTNGASIWTGNTDWGNYNLQVKGTAVEGTEGIGVYFAVKDDKNYSLFNIGGWGNTLMCVEQVVDGVATTTDKLPVHVNYGEEYTISVNVGATSVNGFLNGEKIFQIGGDAPEKTFSGACGFGSWQTSSYYDNLKVVDFATGEVKYENTFDDAASIADIKTTLKAYSGGSYANDPSIFVWEDGKLLNTDSTSTGVTAYFGDPTWTNYIYTMDVMPTSGIEGACIFGAVHPDVNEYTFYNCGGWGNTKGCWHTMRNGGEQFNSFDADGLPCTLNYDEWNTLSLVVLDYAVFSYVNGTFYQSFWWDFE